MVHQVIFPQIIFLTLQLIGFFATVIKCIKVKNWNDLNWHIIGFILTNALLYWGGFYNVLFTLFQ